jgi:hypothetical protein
MYCTTPSGTRYQTGLPSATRRLQSVEEMDIAGTRTRLTVSAGRWASVSWKPGRVTPMKCARRNRSPYSFHDRILDSASAPVMKNNSASASYSLRRSRSVSTVYVGPSRSMSTRLTRNRGLDAVAITVIRYRSSAGLTVTSSFCHGCPVGTKTTSSSENLSATSLAATRCP